jgi:hypothetical protein
VSRRRSPLPRIGHKPALTARPPGTGAGGSHEPVSPSPTLFYHASFIHTMKAPCTGRAWHGVQRNTCSAPTCRDGAGFPNASGLHCPGRRPGYPVYYTGLRISDKTRSAAG